LALGSETAAEDDMAGQRAADLEGTGDGDELFSPQGSAYQVDDVLRQM